MVGDLRQVRAFGRAVASDQAVAERSVQGGTAGRTQLTVDRVADETVLEAEQVTSLGIVDQAAADEEVDERHELGIRRRLVEHGVRIGGVERRPRHGTRR